MLGVFNVILTDVEISKSKDGSDYFYAYVLQGKELKKCRVEDSVIFEKLKSLGTLKMIEAEIYVQENVWEGKLYVNYHLITFVPSDVSPISKK